ncbi:caspase family protein [Actinoplanes sp. NPDC051633]|uniref:caspase family protein n=1 Tax=Actinoplanes sp. NPDC051633 TaxID=3155670 RepID=UPI003418DB7B
MKYALCIGINDYPGTGSDLSGCVNDANDWAEELTKRGFEIEMMLDAQATGAAMRDGMRRVLQRAGSGDTVVITYSGHGTWVRDDNGDEPDGRDEALVPYDIAANGPLLDDELYDILCDRARGVRPIMISDSCHSGTVAKFAPSTRTDADRVRFLPPGVFLSQEEAARAARMPRVTAGRPRHAALLMSGCTDVEFSYDAHFDGRANGAFTYFALKALRELPDGATYRDWGRAIAQSLPSQDYPQRPGVDGSRTQRAWTVL